MNSRPPVRRARLLAMLSLATLLSAVPLLAQQVVQLPSVTRQVGGKAEPYNVLVLLADDLGVDMVGAYGEGALPPLTPNLDALAGEGVLFRNAWSNPVCSATRATIQTGRYSMRTGIGNTIEFGGGETLRLEEFTLPEMLDRGTGHKYAHAAFGKWHLGSDGVGGDSAPNEAGYDYFAGALTNFFGATNYTSWNKVANGVVAPSTTYATTDTVDEASAWIARTRKPWFAYVAFHAPHYPYHAPPAALHSVDFTGVDPNPTVEPLPYYRAMVEALDTEIGRLLAEMDPVVRARTMVIFLGDNGSPEDVTGPPFVPSHGKASLYEGGVGVPLIVNGPLVVKPGSESSALVNTTDLFATVAEIAGVDLEARFADLEPDFANLVLDSVSFVKHIVLPDLPTTRPFLFAESFTPNGTVFQPAPVTCTEPPTDYCQVDLGFQGPGTATLSLCGQPLYGGAEGQLLLTGAPPSSPGFLVTSDTQGFAPLGMGTLVPFPPLTIQPIVTDPAGSFSQEQDVFWVLADQLLFAQAFLQNAGSTELSNAIELRFEQADDKAIRNERYKLIYSPYLCVEEFYDLEADPFETTDLLAQGPLAPEAEAARDELWVHLTELLTP